ncbi:MAG TPA: c-type cytochrome [Chthoniobacterales bacterium]|jgi:putative heme-binding domain-containing protein
MKIKFDIGTSSRRVIAVAILLGAGSFCVSSARAQEDTPEDDFKITPSAGQRTFASTCAGCHGLDGRGSEKAPNIVGNAKVERLSDSQISSLISNGIPGTGMPAFRSLKSTQVSSLVEYLHVLQGRLDARALPGDPILGKKIFSGKGECAGCHSIAGEGGFLGPDLSTFGSTMSAEAILKAILKPARIAPPGFKSAVVTTSNKGRVEGIVRNEDNFSLQLQTADGRFHFYQKSELQSFEYLDHSSMPTNYGERLSRTELNDLVSFVMSAEPPSKSEQVSSEKQKAPE